MKIKWLKLGGYSSLLSFVFLIIYNILAFSSSLSGFHINIYLNIILFVIGFLLSFAFIKLGDFTKNKHLRLSSLIYLILVILIEIYYIICQINMNMNVFLVDSFGLSLNFNTLIVNYLPLGLEGLFMLLIGIHMLKLKDIKLIKISSVGTIIYGVVSIIVNLIVYPVILFGEGIYNDLLINTPGLIVSIIILIGLAVYYVIIAIMFLNASTKFEK